MPVATVPDADRRLDGRVVAVTGAVSGIGLQAALACAAQGAAVALLDRDEAAVHRVACEFPLAGSNVLSVPVDMGDSVSVAAAFGAISAAFGRLDGFFNDAGTSPDKDMGRAEDVGDDLLAQALASSLTGCFLCCQAAVRLIEASGGGSIVNNASTGALGAVHRLEAYSAAKGGIIALTRAFAASYAKRGVRFNAVYPNLPRTSRMAEHRNEPTTLSEQGMLAPVPESETVGGLIVYLLSPESQHLTGSTVAIEACLRSG